MTDKLTGSELVEKAFSYISVLAKECRKALTIQFERKHKGIPFNAVEVVIRNEIESWFAMRDRNVKISYKDSLVTKPGEILVTYLGATKDAHFKMHIDCLFTLGSSSGEAPSYLKSLNLGVDKRDFTR